MVLAPDDLVDERLTSKRVASSLSSLPWLQDRQALPQVRDTQSPTTLPVSIADLFHPHRFASDPSAKA